MAARTSWATRFAVASILGATAVGAASDPVVPPLDAERGGYRVVEADLHVHTRFSDGFLSPLDVVLHARRQGLGAIALTEHNATFPAVMARAWAEQVGGPVVVIGEEITTRDHHLLALGLTATVDPRLPLRQAIDEVHRQGGVVVAAHPAGRFLPSLRVGLDLLDGVEVVHPTAWSRASGDWSPERFLAFWGEVRQVRPRAAAIGSSDYHAGPTLGLATTLVFARDTTTDALLEAIRAGRTVVTDREGGLHGDPALVEALRGEPLSRPARDLAWAGASTLDRFARVVTSAALLLLVLVRRTRAS